MPSWSASRAPAQWCLSARGRQRANPQKYVAAAEQLPRKRSSSEGRHCARVNVFFMADANAAAPSLN